MSCNPTNVSKRIFPFPQSTPANSLNLNHQKSEQRENKRWKRSFERSFLWPFDLLLCVVGCCFIIDTVKNIIIIFNGFFGDLFCSVFSIFLEVFFLVSALFSFDFFFGFAASDLPFRWPFRGSVFSWILMKFMNSDFYVSLCKRNFLLMDFSRICWKCFLEVCFEPF